MKKNSQKHKRVRRVQRGELRSGRKEGRMFVGEGGVRRFIGRRARLNGGGICAGGL